MGVSSLALIGCALASGCYHGSARTATPADLADPDDRWNLVEGVPEWTAAGRLTLIVFPFPRAAPSS